MYANGGLIEGYTPKQFGGSWGKGGGGEAQVMLVAKRCQTLGTDRVCECSTYTRIAKILVLSQPMGHGYYHFVSENITRISHESRTNLAIFEDTASSTDEREKIRHASTPHFPQQ